MASNTSIFEVVPGKLRAPLDQYETLLPGFLGAYLEAGGADFDSALGYLSGALDHQKRVHDDGSKVFRGTITKVEFVNRGGTGDFVLGKKAIIHFTGSSKGKGDDVEQDITTDWYEFNGYNAEDEAFYVALTRTLVDLAQDNIGEEFLIRKAFKEAETTNGGDKVRYLADLIKIGGNGSGGGSKPAAKSSSSSRDDSRDDRDERSSKRSDKKDKQEWDESSVTRLLNDDADVSDAMAELGRKTAADVIKLVTDFLTARDEDDAFGVVEDVLFDGKANKRQAGKIDDILDIKGDEQRAFKLALLASEEL